MSPGGGYPDGMLLELTVLIGQDRRVFHFSDLNMDDSLGPLFQHLQETAKPDPL